MISPRHTCAGVGTRCLSSSLSAASQTMDSVSPIVDCGVHYVDVMCAMVGGGRRPIRVSGIGARLTEDLRRPDM